jgi:hypothetical protein
MPGYIVTNGAPSLYSATMIPLSRVADKAGADFGIALTKKMRTKHLVNEVLFGLSFDVD